MDLGSAQVCATFIELNRGRVSRTSYRGLSAHNHHRVRIVLYCTSCICNLLFFSDPLPSIRLFLTGDSLAQPNTPYDPNCSWDCPYRVRRHTYSVLAAASPVTSTTMCVGFWSLTHPDYALCVHVRLTSVSTNRGLPASCARTVTSTSIGLRRRHTGTTSHPCRHPSIKRAQRGRLRQVTR